MVIQITQRKECFMSTNLVGFLIELGENPVRLDEFRRDSASMMLRANLSRKERTAVASGDGSQIRRALSPDGDFLPVWVQQIVVQNVIPAA